MSHRALSSTSQDLGGGEHKLSGPERNSNSMRSAERSSDERHTQNRSPPQQGQGGTPERVNSNNPTLIVARNSDQERISEENKEAQALARKDKKPKEHFIMPAMPHSMKRQTSVSTGAHRVCWNVEGKRLRSRDKVGRINVGSCGLAMYCTIWSVLHLLGSCYGIIVILSG